MSQATHEIPRACDHFFAEHTSRYDLRCTRCGTSSLDVTHGDDLMLEVWIAWAEQQNPGAASLFRRIQWRLKEAARPSSHPTT